MCIAQRMAPSMGPKESPHSAGRVDPAIPRTRRVCDHGGVWREKTPGLVSAKRSQVPPADHAIPGD